MLFMLPYMANEITAAFRSQTCPKYNGILAGEVPTCQGSSCPAIRTEMVLKSLSNNVHLESQWNYVPSYSPTLTADLQPAFDSIMSYVNDLRLFASELISKRQTIAKGVFVALLNLFDHPGEVVTRQTITFSSYSCTVTPAPPTITACPSMTVTFPYASPTSTKTVVSPKHILLVTKG